MNLEQLVRKNILSLKPYSSARDEFTGTEGIFLDANENPFGELNRYPDPYQKELKKELSRVKGVPAENLFLGNGSDEVIDLLFRIFCNPGKDGALTFSPTYGMYQVSADINDVVLIQLPLNREFQIDFQSLEPFLSNQYLKLIFVCSPNNPTANSMAGIELLLKKFEGIVVVDEAYIDFSESPSWSKRLAEFPNLVVCQTFSKAWGLAAARVGIAFASEEIVALLNKVKPPYNISRPNQEAALHALRNRDDFEEQKREILAQRDWLKEQLSALSVVKKIYPSDANFLLVEMEDADSIYQSLVDRKIIARNRSKQVKEAIRFTVGTAAENKELINALNELSK
jgi:histidinol-phosphate aminotransferase